MKRVDKCKTYQELEQVVNEFNDLVEKQKEKIELENVDFSTWLENMIKYNNYNKTKFAEKMQVSANQVSNWCNGLSLPNNNNFEKICVTLKIEPKELRRRIREERIKRKLNLKGIVGEEH